MKKSLIIGLCFLFILTACTEKDVYDAIENIKISDEFQPQPKYTSDISGPYLVSKITDGDTFHVIIDGKDETIRLIGIDTPETVSPTKPIQCFGPEASAKAKELLENKSVYLETDSSQGFTDRYDRLLRYALIDNGPNNATSFNSYMIENGYAKEYTYDKAYKYQDVFKKLEIQANGNKAGLWGACNEE